MLRRPSELVAECYQRASAAAVRAEQAKDGDSRKFWLGCEQRWLSLAKHQEVAEQFTAFVLSRSAVAGYRVQRTEDGLWEWRVIGNHPDVVFAGTASDAVAARVAALQFIADLSEVPLN